MLYELIEIGFDKSIETKEGLIKIAQVHCSSFEDRQKFLPIDTLKKAINYFNCNGFIVKKLN